MDLKQAAISIAMIVFVLSSMLGMGLGLRVSEIVAPLRNWRLVDAVARGELRRDALRRTRVGENPAFGRVDGDRPAAAGPGRRRALLAKTRTDRQRQSRVCRRTDGAADGRDGGISADRVAAAAARRLGEPGANCAIARAADAASVGRRAGGQGESSQTSPRRSSRCSTRRRTSA